MCEKCQWPMVANAYPLDNALTGIKLTISLCFFCCRKLELAGEETTTLRGGQDTRQARERPPWHLNCGKVQKTSGATGRSPQQQQHERTKNKAAKHPLKFLNRSAKIKTKHKKKPAAR